LVPTWVIGANDPKDVAAIVNGDKITVTEINRTAQSLPQYQKLQYDVLEDMIVKTLLYQESVKAGIKVDSSEVNAGFKEYIGKLNMSPEAVKRELKRMNLTEDMMKSEIKKQMMVERFLKNRSKTLNLNVTDDEVKTYYNEHPDTFNKPERVTVKHILIKLAQNADAAKTEEVRKKISELREKIKKGESFSDIAKKYSDDKTTAEAGGEIKGEITRNAPLPKAFIDAAFLLDKGKVSDPVKTVLGFHLIQLIDKKPAEKSSLAEIKDTLKYRLLEQKSAIEMKQYVDTLVDKSNIKVLIDKQGNGKKKSSK
jgi:parvulin-like peptidyl-prolyl isomerase